jgi:hypothetical protein
VVKFIPLAYVLFASKGKSSLYVKDRMVSILRLNVKSEEGRVPSGVREQISKPGVAKTEINGWYLHI